MRTLIAFICIDTNNNQFKNIKEDKTPFMITTKDGKIFRKKFDNKYLRTMKEILKHH